MGFAALMGEHTQKDNVGAAAIVIPSRPSIANKTTPGSSSRTSLGVEVSKFQYNLTEFHLYLKPHEILASLQGDIEKESP